MPKPTLPARPAIQRPKPNPSAATPATATPRPPSSAPIKLSSGDAKLMAAVLREMLKR
jgi:hypothetical protein